MLNKVAQTLILISLILFTINLQANQHRYDTYQNQSRYTNNYPAQQQESPVVILERSINNVLDFLAESDSKNIHQLKNYVNKEIAPSFDFAYMSRWVVGKRYSMMNDKQKDEFQTKFTNVFLSTFIEKVTKSRKSLPRISRFMSKRQSQNEARASVMLGYSNRTQVRVEFRFLNTPNGWKVIDVKANGISALLYFRNYFIQRMKPKRK